MELIIKFFSDETGAAALEYAIILALLGVALIAGITAVGASLSGTFRLVSEKIPG